MPPHLRILYSLAPWKTSYVESTVISILKASLNNIQKNPKTNVAYNENFGVVTKIISTISFLTLQVWKIVDNV
jgi:hypothetical protein